MNQKGKRGQEDVRKRLLDALRQTFRPEFLNRVDDIIVFNTLSKEHLSVIIDLQLKRARERSSPTADRSSRSLPAAKEVMMTDGYDPAYGARPMRRSIQRLIQDPLSLRLLGGRIPRGRNRGGRSGWRQRAS